VVIFEIVAGLVLLLAGKRLFWLAIAVAGFFIGFQVGADLFEPGWASWVCGAGLGLAGGILAVLYQSVIVVLAGLLLGAVGGHFLGETLLASPGDSIWLFRIGGGIVGAVVSLTLFDIGLMILTALAGAGLILNSVEVTPTMEIVLYAVLVTVGFLVQSKLVASEKSRRTTAASESASSSK